MSVGSALDRLSKLQVYADRLGRDELSVVVTGLRQSLLDTRRQVNDLQRKATAAIDENRRLREAARQAAAHPPIASRVELRVGCLWLRSPLPYERPGPYCNLCFTTSKQLVPLEALGDAGERYYCERCDGTFG